MVENPWLHLPTEQPYVLSEDRERVEAFNAALSQKHKHFLHTDKLLPEAFIGTKDAPVVLLSNNPGISGTEENVQARQSTTFREWVRNNLHHNPSDYPFFYLNPEFKKSGGGDWWDRKLKSLITQLGCGVVARSILNVVYFPYPSLRFGHERLRLSSQDYGFDLVRDAVSRDAVIVLMRPGKQTAWEEAVPQLKGYARFFSVKNPRTPAISPNNCARYSEVESAIATFAKTRGWKTGDEHAPVS